MNKLSSKKRVPGNRTRHKNSLSPAEELRRMKKELRIEASLEKIRKRTLKMKNSRELEKIAALFFRELKSLKAIPADARTYFSQIDPATTSTLVWMTRPGGEIRPGSHRTPLTHPSVRKAFDAWKKKKALCVRDYSGRSLKSYLAFVKSLPHVKTDKAYQQLFRNPPERMVMSEAIFKQGAIGVMTGQLLEKNSLELLIRFANVFELAFTRFLDLKKAEEQTRQVQIEAALERLRVSVLAMKKPGDLIQTCGILFKQLKKLGFRDIRNSQIAIANDEKSTYMNYEYYDHDKKFVGEVPYHIHPFVREMAAKMRKNKNAFFSESMTGARLADWKNFLLKLSREPAPKLQAAESLYYYYYSLGPGGLGFCAYSPLSGEETKVLMRFRNVFNFTYRRYLDMEQAIAHAREAKIEASLEKVRAQALGMHKSGDLLNVCRALFKELTNLGYKNLRNAIIHTFHDEKGTLLDYDYSDLLGGHITTIPYKGNTVIKDFISQIRKSEQAFAGITVTGKTLSDWKTYRKRVGQPDDPRLNKAAALHYYIYSVGNASIGISSFETVREEKLQILKRFRNVFDFAYRRYQDVAEAEAQAREAQVQLALERVRARTMAMQRSEELIDTSFLLYEQFKKLGRECEQFSVITIHEDARTIEVSATYQGRQFQQAVKTGYQDHPVFKKIVKAWRSGKNSATLELAGAALRDYNRYRNRITGTQFNISKTGRSDRWIINMAFFSKGLLSFSTEKPVPGETIQLLERFAAVFEQTYTRFLDLQKAEAQARESEIQLALERVRARTMAMHHSKELAETAAVLFRQLNELGYTPERMNIGFVKEEKGIIEFWSTEQGGKKIERLHSTSIEEPTTISKLYKGWKSGMKSMVIELSGEQLKEWLRYLKEEVGLPFRDELVSQKRYHSTAFFKYGLILISTPEPAAEEVIYLLPRFAHVFEQTFTRFLDLQKAEAQAREAQIEASLERVRSSAMAMHKSEDLKACVSTVFEEMNRLKLGLIRCGIAILDKEKPRGDIWITVKKGKKDKIQVSGNEPLDIHPMLKGAYEAWLKKKDFAYVLDDDALQEYYRVLKNVDFLLPITKSQKKDTEVSHQYYFNAVFQHGSLYAFLSDVVSDEVRSVMKRFAGVLNLTYSRFLDLQKAEAQAREAQIEASLERVRAKALAMHSSDDLSAAINLFFKQLKNLDLVPRRCGVGIINEAARTSFNMATTATMQGNSFKVSGEADMESHPLLTDVFNHWKKQQEYFPVLNAEEVKEYTRVLRSQVAVTDFKDETQYGYFFPFKHGYFSIWSEKALTEDELNICRRFTTVISLTYRRYLDLREAETQAREAQIETALERIRSRSMAMHHTSELQDVINTVHQQFNYLNIADTGGAFIAINKEFEKENKINCWGAGGMTDYIQQVEIPVFNRPILTHLIHRIKKGPGFFTEEYTHEEKIEFFKHMFSHPPLSSASPERRKEVLSRQGGYTRSCIVSKYTSIFIINHHGEKFSDAENDILKRFGNVFEQSYTRFLDLRKAEEQARESQIEASLERVRAKAMAMHSSDDLASTVSLFFSELNTLRVMPHRCGVSMMKEKTRDAVFVATTATEEGQVREMKGVLNLSGHPVLDAIFDHWKKQQDYHPVLRGDEIKNYYEVMNPQVEFPGFSGDAIQYGHYFSFQEGFVFTWTEKEFTGDEIKIFRRFTSVISLTYRRYLDLREAEAQAREAQIEAALERVRARTMAMHKSDELAETAAHLFKQFNELGIHPYRCNIGIIDEENKNCRLWSTTNKGDVIPVGSFIPVTEYPVMIRMYNDWRNRKSGRTVIRLSGQERIDWIQYIRNFLPFAEYRPENINTEQIKKEMAVLSCFSFKQGFIVIHTTEENSEADLKIMERFTKVFEQTYTRFLDLQKAEEQAREAVKQASLDRIRGQVASMRSAEDLEHITPLIWQELTHLSIPFIRCGVFIIDESRNMIDAYLSTPDGHGLGLLHLPFNSSEVARETVEHWRRREVYRNHWNKEEFLQWMQSMMEQGQIESKQVYQGASSPPESLDLHFLPFTQGMLYVGNSEPLNDGQVELVKALADAFSIAYARYEDFNKLEKAKESIESALTELKATQAQLIQSEKMASLGELTAGIAHEIQNPLNFVNNFSDVSAELLEELKTEMENEHKEEALALLADVQQNLEKILHHGKRADGIVKGMLQHSRTSSGQKEPTDINLLTDEYLRLAFHGLRAKDKSFSAKFETDFDSSIEKLNIVPQEIGRVILNLINNAFYACTERRILSEAEGSRRSVDENIEPTVWVSTRKSEGKVEVKVKDNGNGIPDAIKEKIFQPFFTTKPAGQGTGLGLSLSYDILKAHGGDLKLETREGEGSEFVILLPISSK